MCLALVCGCSDDPGRRVDGGRPSVSSRGDRSGRAGESLRGDVRGDVFQTAARFEDKTPQSGVRFVYRNGKEAGHFSILESLGGGAALFDYDLDGDVDLVVPGGGGYPAERRIAGLPPALFRNEGGWKFAELTRAAGLEVAPYYSHGAAVGDCDNDGFPDVLITGYGGLLLFRNEGDGTFTERAEPAGLSDKLWSSSAAWGDVDADGDLDLYVAHYVNWSFDNHPFCTGPRPGLREVCPPRSFDPLPDTYYRNNGDGTFTDASAAVGLRKDGKGLGVLIADIDLDGDLDVYVGNDTVPNFLYRNDGTGRFEEVGLVSGTSLSDRAVADGSMGVDLGDFNLDGLPDIWVANFEQESFALYRNEGDCLFQHVSQAMGVTAVGGLYVGWGTVFFDFDRDGDEDVFVSNGHVIRYPVNAPVNQKPLLFENKSVQSVVRDQNSAPRTDRRFVNVAAAAGPYMNAEHMGRGVALGDIDDDGDQDLVVVHTNEPLTLLSNESAGSPNWVSLRLIGVRSSRDPVGAVVALETAAGRQTRQVKAGTSYASSNDPRLFFGLGEATEIRSVIIRWPSGVEHTLPSPEINRTHLVVEGSRAASP